MLTSKRGQFSIGGIVAVVIGLIMIVALDVPVTQDVLKSANT